MVGWTPFPVLIVLWRSELLLGKDLYEQIFLSQKPN